MEEAVASTLEMESYTAPQGETKVSVEERLEHDMCMISSKQGVIPLLESIMSRLEKLKRASDGKGQEKRQEKLPSCG